MNKKIIILLITLVVILIVSFVFLSGNVDDVELFGLSPICVKEWEEAGRFCQEFSEDICKNHHYYSDILETEINCYWANDICRADGICL
jgi:hypothetical protein